MGFMGLVMIRVVLWIEITVAFLVDDWRSYNSPYSFAGTKKRRAYEARLLIGFQRFSTCRHPEASAVPVLPSQAVLR